MPLDSNALICLNISAPWINFVQTDWESEGAWQKEFCVDKELYVVDTNGDNKYEIYLLPYVHQIVFYNCKKYYVKIMSIILTDRM